MAHYSNKKLKRTPPQWPSAALEMVKKRPYAKLAKKKSWRRRRTGEEEELVKKKSWRRKRAGEEEELAKKKEEQLQNKRIREEVLIK